MAKVIYCFVQLMHALHGGHGSKKKVQTDVLVVAVWVRVTKYYSVSVNHETQRTTSEESILECVVRYWNSDVNRQYAEAGSLDLDGSWKWKV
jgi:hypothetical protein